MKTSLNIFLLFLILCASCGSRKANDNKETAVQADTVRKFTLPLIPAMLNTPELRADYLVPVSYTHLDVYKRQMWHVESLPCGTIK